MPKKFDDLPPTDFDHQEFARRMSGAQRLRQDITQNLRRAVQVRRAIQRGPQPVTDPSVEVRSLLDAGAEAVEIIADDKSAALSELQRSGYEASSA